ncbi:MULTISPECIES: hypothetical protein [Maribacter]|uniref:hypothetical protein n=1 Tax=Maribacter TaxID=252356 RepID=UPI00047B5D9F|nr:MULTISPECIES: hypothetical protein [Maribacter]|tara:strand:- start:296 stop:880 length:585 start_codon:yes stop_codon:yes gene_type:complete
MKKITLIFLFLSITTAHSQIRDFSEKGNGLVNLERHQFTINLLGPGIRYELGLFKNVSASTSFTPAFARYQEGYALGFAWHTRIRYYHNFQERLDVNKNTVGNSANYFGPARSIFWEPVQFTDNISDGNSNYAFAFYGGVYGVQRTNRKGFNFNGEIGYGYFRGDGLDNGHGFMVNLNFGWVATKRKSTKPTFD